MFIQYIIVRKTELIFYISSKNAVMTIPLYQLEKGSYTVYGMHNGKQNLAQTLILFNTFES